MKTERKALVVIVALAAAAIALRPQMSSALVVRGDDLAYRGDAARALTMYGRAIAFDRNNESAVDRYTFEGAISHKPALERKAVGISSAFLRRYPQDATVLADRALCYAILRDYVRAERDFARAGELARDPRALTFAGFSALRANRRELARAHFLSALRVDETYEPAVRGLVRAR